MAGFCIHDGKAVVTARNGQAYQPQVAHVNRPIIGFRVFVGGQSCKVNAFLLESNGNGVGNGIVFVLAVEGLCYGKGRSRHFFAQVTVGYVAQRVRTRARGVLLCPEACQFEAFLAAFRFVPQPLARIYICFHGARVPVVLFDELPCHLITAAVGLPLVCYEQCALAFQRVHRGEHHGVAVAGSAVVFDEAM